jgi:hypothetical protein
VRIEAENTHHAWTVYHAQERRTLERVTWVDTDLAQWCEYSGVTVWGILATEIHQAERIEVDTAALRITINPGPWPEIPFEVHNPRAVDAERCMAAVRAMCG